MGTPNGSQHPDDEDNDPEMEALIEELLKPIKDLRHNFDVDIEETLKKYMDKIHEKIEVDGETVNFSRAAMMLQGASARYSKKVDFLHEHSMKILSMIGKDKENENNSDGSSTREKGGRSRAGNANSEFQELNIDIDKNFNKKNRDLVLQPELLFISVTPRELIEKEGQQVSCKVNLYYGQTYELLARKQDFRMSSQFSIATSMFGERLYTEGEEVEESPADVTIENINYMSSAADSRKSTADDADIMDDGGGDGGDDDEYGPCYNDDLETEENPLNASAMSERAAGNVQATGSRDIVAVVPQIDQPVQPDIDFWEPCNIYETSGTSKSVLVGVPYKLPPSLSAKNKAAKSKKEPAVKPVPSIADFFSESSQTLPVATSCPNLAEFVSTEQAHRKQFFKDLKAKSRLLSSGRLPPQLDNDVAPDQDMVEDDLNDAPEPQDEPLQNNYDDIASDYEPLTTIDPHIGGAIGPTLDLDGEALGTEDGDSYESLVNRMVSEFVAKSQAMVASTELARKVNSWHELIAPRLERVSKRATFDINVYGSHILDSFPQENRKTVKRFGDIMRGKPQEDISRYFLSSLMLANCQNVEICSEGAMDDMKLRFLSSRRHHEELEEFMPASQQSQDSLSTSSIASSSSQSHGKRRRLN